MSIASLFCFRAHEIYLGRYCIFSDVIGVNFVVFFARVRSKKITQFIQLVKSQLYFGNDAGRGESAFNKLTYLLVETRPLKRKSMVDPCFIGIGRTRK